MIKKFLKILFLMLFFAGLVFAVKLKKASIIQKTNKPIVSFSSYRQEKGKPVRIYKIKPKSLDHKVKITISFDDEKSFYSYVSKETLEKLKEDSRVLFRDNDNYVEGRIKNFEKEPDRSRGLYKVEGKLTDKKMSSLNYYVADVFAGREENAFVVPQDVVEFDGDSAFLWVVDNGFCFKKEVLIKDRIGENVFIKSGVNLGDSIIVKGIKDLKENDKVLVVGEDNVK